MILLNERRRLTDRHSGLHVRACASYMCACASGQGWRKKNYNIIIHNAECTMIARQYCSNKTTKSRCTNAQSRQTCNNLGKSHVFPLSWSKLFYIIITLLLLRRVWIRKTSRSEIFVLLSSVVVWKRSEPTPESRTSRFRDASQRIIIYVACRK